MLKRQNSICDVYHCDPIEFPLIDISKRFCGDSKPKNINHVVEWSIETHIIDSEYDYVIFYNLPGITGSDLDITLDQRNISIVALKQIP